LKNAVQNSSITRMYDTPSIPSIESNPNQFIRKEAPTRSHVGKPAQKGKKKVERACAVHGCVVAIFAGST
jgi:hypothetical protein